MPFKIVNETYENYWFTPMYFNELWQVRNLLNKLKRSEE